jgi:hypothetical protein
MEDTDPSPPSPSSQYGRRRPLIGTRSMSSRFNTAMRTPIVRCCVCAEVSLQVFVSSRPLSAHT